MKAPAHVTFCPRIFKSLLTDTDKTKCHDIYAHPSRSSHHRAAGRYQRVPKAKEPHPLCLLIGYQNPRLRKRQVLNNSLLQTLPIQRACQRSDSSPSPALLSSIDDMHLAYVGMYCAIYRQSQFGVIFSINCFPVRSVPRPHE
jgi:hypothetical protein